MIVNNDFKLLFGTWNCAKENVAKIMVLISFENIKEL